MIDMTRLFVFVAMSMCVTSTLADYWQERQQFVDLEESQAIGASIKLNDKETIVNDILMSYKWKELDNGFANPGEFLPSKHFFNTRKHIEKSKVFSFLQKLPKGAMLHGHDTVLASGDFVYNLTYSKNLYACVVNERLKLHFFDKINDKSCNWTLLSVLRQNSGFDDFVKTQLTMIVDNPREAYPDINAAWKKFTDTFITVEPMLLYKPIFQEYFYQVLQEFYDDNVSHFEFRGLLPTVYDLSGRKYDPSEVVGMYKETADLFKHNNPDFEGVRFIYGPSRNVDNITVHDYIQTAVKLKNLYPDFIAGFDLVGQEDKGRPLTSFVNQILELPKNIDVFFHAGETNWFGASTDENLVDAVLLGTKRIGHGYAITKHPQVSKIVKERGIGIEICPISNQVLELVSDLRNHPGASLIAQGYPVVICSDDPSFWGAKGLSYDWYMAFMGMASRNADLRFLKQLALNSLQYSSLKSAEKVIAIKNWNNKWDRFIDDFVARSQQPEKISVDLV